MISRRATSAAATAAFVTAIAVLLAGCSSGSKQPTTAPTPSHASLTPSPATTLAALAARGVGTSYSATYRVGGGDPKRKPTVIRIYRLPPSMRVDVVSAGTIASLILNSKGAFSCSASGRAQTCFFVAKPGKPVPPLFDAGLQRVFSTYLQQLAAHADAYDVTPSGTTPANGSLPAGTCFDVAARTDSPAPKVADGTYCLADSGVVTEVRYKSGSLRLERLGSAPAARVVQPYSSPTPIP